MSAWKRLTRRRRPANSEERRADTVRLALQTALIGQVTETMRLVSVERDATLLRVIVFYGGELSQGDRDDFAAEMVSCVGLKLGDPPDGPSVVCHFVRCDEPQQVPVRGEVVFARKGVKAF